MVNDCWCGEVTATCGGDDEDGGRGWRTTDDATVDEERMAMVDEAEVEND